VKFVVVRYFSGFCINEVEAENKDDALELARQLPMDYEETIRLHITVSPKACIHIL
jgi:hypothetical protein